MSVTVHFVEGQPKTYRSATGAARRDRFIVVTRWKTKRQRPDDLEVLDARGVTVAEVFNRVGVRKQVVLGAGRRTESASN